MDYISSKTPTEHFDVLIIGAGISGIGSAVHLGKRCPDKTWAILESRTSFGGTWDLFRYPGIRSDSDMSTLGFEFKPWTDEKVIADGPRILEYLQQTMREHDIERHVRFQHAVQRAAWSSETSRWTVYALDRGTGEPVVLTCNVLHMCTGYYDYEQGHAPRFEGQDNFQGELIHPQFWPEETTLEGKRVVVIGSGATAMTIVPAIADQVEHVTMLQRSPTYVVAQPNRDRVAQVLFRLLPDGLAHRLNRWKNALFAVLLYRYCQARPEKAARLLIGRVRKALGPDFDVERHFVPTYGPWDQRLCLLPDGDLFDALGKGQASVVTDHIDRFTPSGIRLKSGDELEADVIVTATGLKLRLLAGIELSVDGETRDLRNLISYKGVMFGNLPNLTNSMGYTNASWTLKADLISGYLCRLLRHMDRTGTTKFEAVQRDPDMPTQPFMDLTSGYVTRSAEELPKQGLRAPWRLHQNYLRDVRILKFGRLDDGVLTFTAARAGTAEEVEEELEGVA